MADENSLPFGEEFGLQSQKPRMGAKNSTPTSSSVKRKALAEKNNGSSSPTRFGITMQAKPNVNLRGDGVEVCSYPYDPLTNFTSPRPQFLRYDPNRRHEILMRIEGEKSTEEDESGGSSSHSSEPEKPVVEEPLSISPVCSRKSVEEEVGVAEIDMVDEEEDVEKRTGCLKMAWNLFLIVGLLFSNYYFSSIPPGSVPSLQDHHGGDFVEGLTKIQKDQIILSGILMTKIFGMSEVCFNVHSKELICEVGDAPEEHESADGIELEDGATGQLPLIGEKIHEAVSSTEQTNHEILDPHSNQTVNSPLLLSDSSQVSAIEAVPLNSSNDQDGTFHLEEAQVMKASTSNDSMWFPRFQTYPTVISDTPVMEENEETEENEAESIFVFSSQNAPHMLLSVYLLASSIGYFLHKSLLGYRKNQKPLATSTKPAVQFKFMPPASREKKQIESKIAGPVVRSMPPSFLSNLAVAGEEDNGTLPAVVQSLGDLTVSERTTKRRVGSVEKSQLSQYSRRSTRKNLSPFAKEESSFLTEVSSVLKETPATFPKQLMEENPGIRTEAMKMTPTPLRRSIRLQSRVTSTMR